jgi:hypothetical protein
LIQSNASRGPLLVSLARNNTADQRTSERVAAALRGRSWIGRAVAVVGVFVSKIKVRMRIIMMMKREQVVVAVASWRAMNHRDSSPQSSSFGFVAVDVDACRLVPLSVYFLCGFPAPWHVALCWNNDSRMTMLPFWF